MMSTQQFPTKLGLIKGGMGAGLMGGFALFSSVLQWVWMKDWQ